jgi:hypothetical protein
MGSGKRLLSSKKAENNSEDTEAKVVARDRNRIWERGTINKKGREKQ